MQIEKSPAGPGIDVNRGGPSEKKGFFRRRKKVLICLFSVYILLFFLGWAAGEYDYSRMLKKKPPVFSFSFTVWNYYPYYGLGYTVHDRIASSVTREVGITYTWMRYAWPIIGLLPENKSKRYP